jgi:tetratricopeptide (TPR) repeat protein
MVIQDSIPAEKTLLDAAITLQRIGEKKDALRLVKKLLKRNSQEIEAAILAGLIYQDLQESKDAEKYFRLALTINPQYPNALKSWGLFLLTQQRKTEALDILSQYLKLDKWDDIVIIEYLFDLASELGGEEKGLEVLKEGWEHSLDPSIGERYGIQLRLANKIKDALTIFQILAKASPEPDNLNQLAIALELDNQYEKAISVYKQAIDQVYELISKVDLDLELNDDKYEDGTYREDLEIVYSDLQSSRDASYYLLVFLTCNLSHCYLASGNKNDAIETARIAEHRIDHWEEGMNIGEGKDTSLFYVIQTLVIALISMGQYKEADQTINEYLAHNKPDEDDLIKLYKLHVQVLEKGQLQAEGVGLMKHAMEQFPEEAFFYYQLADLLANMEKLEDAVAVLENAFNILPVLAPDNSKEGKGEYWYHRLKLAILLHRIGSGETAWKKIAVFFDYKSEDSYSLIMSALYSNLCDEKDPDYKPTVQLIEQLFSQFPYHPALIWLMSTVYFFQNNLLTAVAVMENIQKSQSTDSSLRLVILNNLGYGYLLQGKLELAQTVLEQAFKIENAVTFSLEDFWESLGVVLFIDGVFITTNQLRGSEPLIMPSCYPARSIMAVMYNMVALALARKDIDQATALLTGYMVTLEKEEMACEQTYLSLLSLARYRNDFKTAQVAWMMKLTKEGYLSGEEQLKIVLPGVYSWLFPEAKDNSID